MRKHFSMKTNCGSGRCSLNSYKKGKGIVRACYGKEWDF